MQLDHMHSYNFYFVRCQKKLRIMLDEFPTILIKETLLVNIHAWLVYTRDVPDTVLPDTG